VLLGEESNTAADGVAIATREQEKRDAGAFTRKKCSGVAYS
jgi:hypothetical protein